MSVEKPYRNIPPDFFLSLSCSLVILKRTNGVYKQTSLLALSEYLPYPFPTPSILLQVLETPQIILIPELLHSQCNTEIKMGNCIFRAFQVEGVIKVITSNGGVMELYPPITAECITNEFPGHAIFRTLDHFSQPLLHSEELLAGESYHLLPIRPHRGGIMRDNSDRKSAFSSLYAPYRMTFDNHGNWRSTQTEVVPKYNSAGVWKVKLVISPEQLTEILSQESRTEALIESVRTVAKCGSGVPSAANSDQWSLGSSWKVSMGKMA